MKLRVAACCGFLGVGLGAFGAHALKEKLVSGGYMDAWQTAVMYHILHSVVLLALALVSLPRLNAAYWAIFIGIVVFCGSLYLMAIVGIAWLGAITPIGGIAFLAGWALIFLKSKG